MTWHPGYPNAQTNRIKMAIQVSTKPSFSITGNGMFNAFATGQAVPLCQFRHD